MNPEAQHQYFDTAYRTGSDIWTHIPYHKTAIRMMPSLLPDSIVLDIGSGRGVWAFKLIEMGYRVIGIDYVRSIVDSVNAEIKMHSFADKARFIYGVATDLPFTDNSFPLVTDIGLLQHLPPDQWNQYFSEITRVVSPGGYILSITMSSETPRFLGFTPKVQNLSPYEKFGVMYHFFAAEDLNMIFSRFGFQPVSQEVQFFDTRSDPADSLGLLFTLYKKN